MSSPPQSPSPPTAPAAAQARFSALQSRNFRLIWFGLLVSNAGTWMASTAEGWLVTDLKPDDAAFWLGAIALSFAIPMLVLPPFGGAVADRFSRIRLLWVVQIAYLLMSIAIAVVVISGRATVWSLIAFAFGNGVVLAFDSPVRHSLLPDTLSREQLTSGISLNSVSFTGASLVGPAIAGLLIPVIGVGGVFAFNAFSCFATLVAISRLKDMPATSRSSTSTEKVFESIAKGVRYVLSVPTLAGLMLVSMVAGLLARSYNPLLAVFARDVFHVGSGAYGLMISAGGLGALAGAIGLAGRRDVANKGSVIEIAVVGQASLLLLFAALGSYWIGVPLLALIGLLSAVAGALTSTVIQLTVPNELRGRIMSLYVLTLVGVPSIGAFILGAASELSSPRIAVGVGATIVVVATIVIFATNEDLREA